MEGKGEFSNRSKDAFGSSITGLKVLGVRELSYKLAFAACMVSSQSSKAKIRAGYIYALLNIHILMVVCP